MKTLIVSAFILFSASTSLSITSNSAYVILKETPAKTVCIKNAMANDANKFFSTTTNLSFEIYKPGTKGDLVAIIDNLKAVEGVENCTAGTVTGDYYSITLTLKVKKDKAWFSKAFSAAGLEHIKINNNEVVEVSKL